MKLLGLDLETTGLDFDKDHVTEIGFVLIDTEESKPLVTVADMLRLPDDVEVSEEITEITKITKPMLDMYGIPAELAVARLAAAMSACDYVVAHNGNGFDKPFLEKWCERLALEVPEKPWIDTYEDVPYPKHYRYRNLTYLCGEHGFVNPFPHAALFDVMAMMKVLSFYDIDEVIERRNTPWVIARAMVSFQGKDKAKERGYKWQQLGNETYPKCWVKKLKQPEFEIEQKEAGFEVVEIK